MAKITEIEGIGDVNAQKLRDAGVTSVESLLEKGKTPKGRKELAETTGISGKLILGWVNRHPASSSHPGLCEGSPAPRR